MKRLPGILILWHFLWASTALAQSFSLLPVPAEVKIEAGKAFELPELVTVASTEDAMWNRHLMFFGDSLERFSGGKHRLRFTTADIALDLKISKSESLDDEAYKLEVTSDQIRIEVSGPKGLARATASLMQLIGQSKSKLPLLVINDRPDVPYRSLLIDMGRNPHSFELLQETIDLCWFYKVDSIHLHLTDDQRFAFPSTAYPKLWDGKITLDQFKQLEKDAAARGVTLIPELEVPGHSGKLRGIYPEVFGKSPTDLAGSETAFEGIKTLIDEMLAVFESTPYIHIGGDEAYGVPEELQRDLINKLHAYLKSKGKQTIVWEGPRAGDGDNRVNQEVIHINWRTINYSPDQMLKDGYRVINAAWDPLYIVDHYPRTNFTMTTPQHIYENLELTRFKHVNPGIPTFDKPIEVEPSDQLIGFCMCWWEGREENYFSQVFPRLVPLADIGWNPGANRDFDDFKRRSEVSEATRKSIFYPVIIESSSLSAKTDGVFHGQTQVSLSTTEEEAQIRFTLDGTVPNVNSKLYSEPFPLSKSAVVRAAAFVNDKRFGHCSHYKLTAVEPVVNLALGKPVTSSATSSPPFSVGRVTDGGTNNLDFYLGYPATSENPIAITVDLGDSQMIGKVVVHSYTISGSFEKYCVLVSEDGDTFVEVGSRLEPTKAEDGSKRGVVEHTFEPRQAQYVQVRSEGNRGYVFDSFSKLVEIQVFGE